MNKNWLKEMEEIRPFKIFKIKGVSFLIYKAKNLHNPKWNSSLLKEITKEARKSFLRYGRVPLIDGHDKHAEVYLCRAIDELTEEWFCLRFVPGYIDEILIGDLSQYIFKGERLSNSLLEEFFPDVNNKLIAMSRICGIPPYNVNLTKIKITSLPARMKYLSKSFALVNKIFFSQHEFIYLAGIFRGELLGRILRFNSRLMLSLSDASKILGCKSRELRLDRTLLAYNFPGYFLNVPQLVDLLEKLIKQGKLSFDSVKSFVKSYKPNFKKYLKEKKYVEVLKEIKGLEKLLLLSDIIPKAKITGEDLRALVAKHVDDGPILKIVPVDKWKKQLDKIKL